jgi:hypothetical protein
MSEAITSTLRGRATIARKGREDNDDCIRLNLQDIERTEVVNSGDGGHKKVANRLPYMKSTIGFTIPFYAFGWSGE